MSGLCDVVFQILSLATRKNQRNGVHLAQSIDTLLFHYTGVEGVFLCICTPRLTVSCFLILVRTLVESFLPSAAFVALLELDVELFALP